MIFAISRVLTQAAAVLLLSGSLALPLRAQTQTPPDAAPEPQSTVPEELLLPKEELDSAANRKRILEDLYQRLREADDEEGAGLVASAIEKLWLRSGSDTVDLLMARAGEMMEKKEFETALDLLNSIVEIAPEYPEGWTRRAAVFFARDEYGKSLQDLRRALALDPSHYKAIQGLGLLLQEIGEKEAALKAFRQVLKVHPHLDEVRQAEKELSREVEGQGI